MSTIQNASIDPDAVLWSAPEQERVGRPLLVMMHGWSYDETHLFRLVRRLPTDTVVASVRARVPEAGGYAWFPRAGNPIGNPRAETANGAVGQVMSWLDTLELDTVDTVDRPSSIGLLGFSQGGAMALQMMRHAPERFAYAVSLAGFVVAGDLPGDDVLARTRPPVFWGRGADDTVIPESALTRTSDWLAGHVDADVRVYAGLGHDVAGQEITDLVAFIATHQP